MYIKVMIGLLVVLWGVIACEWVHRRPIMTPSLLIGRGDLPNQAVDVRPILNRRVGDLRLDNVELNEAIETLRIRSHADIVVDWDEVAKVLFRPSARVSVCLFDASLETSIHAILRSLNHYLTFGIDRRGTIVITSNPADAPAMLIVYDVRDLAPQEPPPPAVPLGQGGIGVGGGGGAFYSPPSSTVSPKQGALLDAVRASMKHGSKGNADLIPSALSFAGRWVVMETPENHRRLQEILRRIREADAKTQPSKATP